MGNYVYDLDVWKESHRLVLKVYKITITFPPSEMYGLTSQFRRAAYSVPSNLAEGYRRRTLKDRIHFYNIALCSVEEAKYFSILANDLQFMNDPDLFNEYNFLGKRLFAFINAVQNKS